MKDFVHMIISFATGIVSFGLAYNPNMTSVKGYVLGIGIVAFIFGVEFMKYFKDNK